MTTQSTICEEMELGVLAPFVSSVLGQVPNEQQWLVAREAVMTRLQSFPAHPLRRRAFLPARPLRLIAAGLMIVLVLAVPLANQFNYGNYGNGDGVVFAAVVKPILTAHTLTFTIRTTGIDSGPSWPLYQMTSECAFQEPDMVRMTLTDAADEGTVLIIDGKKGLILMLEPRMEMARFIRTSDTMHRSATENALDFFNLRALLHSATSESNATVEAMRTRQMDGVLAVGFRLTEPDTVTTIWAAADSLLPISIECTQESLECRTVFSDFRYNTPLDKTLFEMTVPPNYHVEHYNVGLNDLSEKDLVDTLRAWAEEHSGGFPPSLQLEEVAAPYDSEKLAQPDSHQTEARHLAQEEIRLLEEKMKCNEASLKHLDEATHDRRDTGQTQKDDAALRACEDALQKQLDSIASRRDEIAAQELAELEGLLQDPQAPVQRLLDKQARVLRGLTFVEQLPTGSDLHYNGTEARFGDAQTPFVWYRPLGSVSYRVIYGDLSVRDVGPEALPQ